MNMADEQRREVRLEQGTMVFIEACPASFKNNPQSYIIVSKTLDISFKGLKVQLGEEVPGGSLLRLCADVPVAGSNKELSLKGEVKWVQKIGGLYEVGLELFDFPHTDIVEWQEMVATVLKDEA